MAATHSGMLMPRFTMPPDGNKKVHRKVSA